MSHLFHPKRLLTLLALVLATAGPLGAQEPDPNLKATYGTVKLQAGFLPDPYQKDLQAGGPLRTNLGGVKAHVARAPDFSLHYTAGKYPLMFSVKSTGDTTLLINLPNGTWVADDDGGGGLDPLLRIARPASGRYDVYVGTYHKDLLPATLLITERDGAVVKKPVPAVPVPAVPTRPAVPAVPFNPSLPACHIISAGIDNYRTQNKLNGCLNDARNTIAAFRAQTGTVFRSVNERILLDDAASHGAITRAFQGLTTQGAAGDYMVLFLSGHGARTNGNKGDTWFFLPFDFEPRQFANTALTDRQILDIGDQLVRQKKNVVIIVDACFVGQLNVTAQPYLQRYQSMNQGGMVLLLSSAANEESTALGNFSAFAKAFADAMTSAGDLNKDSAITLSEIQTYSKRRTAELLVGARSGNRQNPVVSWSSSLSRDTPLARTDRAPDKVATVKPQGSHQHFKGTETLAGYGAVSFDLYPDGRAVMVDAKSTMEGNWRQQGGRYTLTFSNGSVIYTGTLNGATLSGSATSPSVRRQGTQSWTWTVRKQPG